MAVPAVSEEQVRLAIDSFRRLYVHGGRVMETIQAGEVLAQATQAYLDDAESRLSVALLAEFRQWRQQRVTARVYPEDIHNSSDPVPEDFADWFWDDHTLRRVHAMVHEQAQEIAALRAAGRKIIDVWAEGDLAGAVFALGELLRRGPVVAGEQP